MAMTQAGMKAAILTALNAGPITSPDAFADKLATALYGYITANADVLPGATLIAPGGLSPLPCTGKGTIA